MINTAILTVSLLCPLQEADPHFQSYRIMMIESCTYQLEDLIHEVEDPILRERMHSLTEAIQYNLGNGNMY